MTSSPKSAKTESNGVRGLAGLRRHGLALLGLGLVLAVLFRDSFDPALVLFSNDSPLGSVVAQYDSLLSNMRGAWQPLYWLGSELVSNRPTVSLALGLFMGPISYAKFYAVLALLLLGYCSWVFFRAAGFSPALSLVAGLAAMLNSNAFSNACWGLPSWVVARAMVFLALAVLVSGRLRRPWMKVICGGAAVGMCVMEGFDVGAIFSLYVAAFALFIGSQQRVDGPAARRWIHSAMVVVCLAAFALLTAAQAVTSLVRTQIQGVASMQSPTDSTEARWDAATQWSLPKTEGLRVLIPGLFGYRMDTPDGGQYWGSVGQQPGWEKHRSGLPRYSGSGEYAGVLTVLVSLWGITASLRKQGSTWTAGQRRMVWFCAVVAGVSLVLAFGRHAPLYWWFYHLPYFSTVRNPIKFMQPFQVALVILFAYGLRDLVNGAAAAPAKAEGLSARVRRWWMDAAPFERRWCLVWAGTTAAALILWLVLSAPGSFLVRHLQGAGFDANQALAIQSFAAREAAWFLVFLVLTVLVLLGIRMGGLRGHTRWWVLGLLLVVDLSRANLPWIRYENYQEKYASNPLIEVLRDKPFERRVGLGPNPGSPAMSALGQVYHAHWLQHLFPYYQVQSLDVPQEPRMTAVKSNYVSVLGRVPLRYWQLTNTRYLVGLAASTDAQQPFDYAEWLNQQLDPVHRRFQSFLPFTLGYATNSNVLLLETNRTGPFALVEFRGALPRARLYTRWEQVPDMPAALRRLADPDFDPETRVVIEAAVENPPPGSDSAEAPAPAVEFVSYAPKEVRLRVQTSRPSMLLLNDQYHENWRGSIDGQPVPVFRANAAARGMMVLPGTHEIAFEFSAPSASLWLSLGALALALATVAAVIIRPGVPGDAGDAHLA